MIDDCFRLDEMESLLDLAPDDPRRAHLDACPLCRARLAEFRAFIAEGPPAPGSRPAEAGRDLEAFVTRMVHGTDGAEEERGFRSRFRLLRVPRFALIPGLAAAAAAVLIIIAVLHPYSGIDRRRPQLRSPAEQIGDGAVLSSISAAVLDGAVTFTWRSLAGSERYEVQLYDADLEAVAQFEANRDTSLTIELNRIQGERSPLWWRVAAFRGGDECAHSALSALHLGER